MHIMDLVIQGVGRFTESRKFPLKPGFNVIYGPTESGKTTLVNCLLDLLYPDRYRDDEASLISYGEPAASRAGLTLASGQDVYRILKDFKAGKISLTQYNPASQKFEQMADDPVQVSSILASAFELPSFDVFYNLYISAADRMPSALPLMEEAEPAQDLHSHSEHHPGQTRPPSAQPGPGPGMPGPGMPGMGGGMQMPGQMMPGFMPGMMQPGMAPGTVVPGMMPGGMPGMMPGFMGMPGAPGMVGGDGMTNEEREKKLTSMLKELKEAERVEEIQYEIDGHQQKAFEIESKMKSAGQFDEFMNTGKEQLDKYPILKRLPENIDERLDRYKGLLSMQGEEVEKFDQESLKYDDEFRFLSAFPPILQQQLFMIGAGLLVGGIVMFVASKYMDVLKYLSALSFVGLGMVFWTTWQHINRLGRRTELEQTLNDLEEKKQGVIKRFQVEMAVIEKLMKETDSDAVEELKNKVAKYRDLEARYQSVLDRKKQLIKELNVESLTKQGQELKSKIGELEDELRRHAAISMDINEMRKEITRLETVIRQTNPNSAVLKDAAPAASEGDYGVPDFGPGAGAGDGPGHTVGLGPGAGAGHGAEARVHVAGVSRPGVSGSTRAVGRKSGRSRSAPQAYEHMLKSGAQLFSIERNQLIAHMRQRFNLYVQALFAKRYSEARIDPDGSIALKSAEGNRWMDFDQLTPAARDTGYLALQITLLELSTQKRILPIILDNSALRLDETAAVVAGKAFKRVSERTQVVFLSAQRAPLQFADNSLNLA
ncbi:MAG TPA: AAA family ATPase [bacterium]|nr:AAA family ATPase [bacterium]